MMRQRPSAINDKLLFATSALLCLLLAACSSSEDATENTVIGDTPDPAPTPIDSQPPVVNILTPDDDGRAETSETTIALSGQASDNTEVTRLWWSSNRGASGSIAVAENWRSSDITVFSGSNVLTVNAEDAAGNRSSDTITVVYQPAAAPDDAIAMVSFQANLANAVRLADNTISRQFAYLFFEPSEQWTQRGVTQVEFYCCRALTGAAQDHLPRVIDSAPPWALPIDLNQFEAGTRRELYIDIIYADNGERANQRVEFNLATESGGTNAAPSISGSPSTRVTAGDSYSFVPTASDPDGDMLTFSVNNLPRWASFDTATGQISGTPSNNDVGSFNNVRVRVTDGIDTVSLPLFDIQVDAIALRSVTLNWTPPDRREDGTPLDGLSGYRVYYGQVSGVYPNRRDISDGGISSATVDNLQPGTWYLAITSLDNNGLESELSNEVAKQAQ
ncbi:MAG: putative Ig domain-containing protein [Pseudomonadota bacterium]